MNRTPKFEILDVVLFRADRQPNLWNVREIDERNPTSIKVVIAPIGHDGEVQETYAHLIALAEPIMQFFRYAHLPEELQMTSRPFAALANELVRNLPRNPERTVALRKLLEAKDAAVRAAIYQG